jgi:hypothetical protein
MVREHGYPCSWPHEGQARGEGWHSKESKDAPGTDPRD